MKHSFRGRPWLAFSAFAQTPCVDGFADGYPCSGLDLLSVRTLEELGGGANGNDCWGWVDRFPTRIRVVWAPRRVVHCGRHGCGEPLVVGACRRRHPASGGRQGAQQPRVHRQRGGQPRHASGGPDPGVGGHRRACGAHPVASYIGFGNAHNIAINQETGFAYAVGTNTAGGGCMPSTSPTQVPHLWRGPTMAPTRTTLRWCFTMARHRLCGQGSGVLFQRRRWRGHRGRHRQIGHGPNRRVQLQPIGIHAPRVVERGRSFLYFNDELDESNYGNGTRTYIATCRTWMHRS